MVVTITKNGLVSTKTNPLVDSLSKKNNNSKQAGSYVDTKTGISYEVNYSGQRKNISPSSGGRSSKKPIATPTPTAVKSGGTLLDSTQASREATARSLAEASRQKAFQNAVQQEALRRQRLNLPSATKKPWEGKLLSPGDVGYVKQQKIVYLPEGSKLSGLDLNTTIFYTDKFGRLTGDARIGNTSVGSGKLRELKGMQAGRIDSRYLQNIAQNIKIGELNRKQAVSNIKAIADSKNWELKQELVDTKGGIPTYKYYWKNAKTGAIQNLTDEEFKEINRGVVEPTSKISKYKLASEKTTLEETIKKQKEEKESTFNWNIFNQADTLERASIFLAKEQAKGNDLHSASGNLIKSSLKNQVAQLGLGLTGFTKDMLNLPQNLVSLAIATPEAYNSFVADPIGTTSKIKSALVVGGANAINWVRTSPTEAIVRIGAEVLTIKGTSEAINSLKNIKQIKSFVKASKINNNAGRNIKLGIGDNILEIKIVSKSKVKNVLNTLNELNGNIRKSESFFKSPKWQSVLNKVDDLTKQKIDKLQVEKNIKLSSQQRQLLESKIKNYYTKKLFDEIKLSTKQKGYLVLEDGSIQKISKLGTTIKNVNKAFNQVTRGINKGVKGVKSLPKKTIKKVKSKFLTDDYYKSKSWLNAVDEANELARKETNKFITNLENKTGKIISNANKELLIKKAQSEFIKRIDKIRISKGIGLEKVTKTKQAYNILKSSKNRIKSYFDKLKKEYSPKLGARELEIQKQIKEAGSKAKKAKLYKQYFGKEKITKPISFYQSNEWQKAINIIDNKIKSTKDIIEKNLGRRLTESEINKISNFREKLINNLDEARISKGIGINKPKISSRIKNYFNKLKKEYSPKLGARELEIQKQIRQASSKAKKAKYQKYIIEGDRFLTISKGNLIRNKQINKLNKLADEITKDFNSKNYGKNLASNSLKKKVSEQIIRDIKKGRSLQSAIDYAETNLKKIRKFINNKERIIDYSKKNIKRIDNLNDKIEFKISTVEKENIPKKYKPSGSGSQQLLMKQKVKTKQKIKFEAQPSQIKSRFKSKQKSLMKQKIKVKQKIKMAGKSLSASRILGMMSKPAIKSKYKFAIGSKSKIASASKSKSLSKSASKTANKSLTKTAIKSDILSNMKTPTKTILQQKTIQKTKKIIAPFSSKKSPQKQISQKKYGYVVYARPLKKFKSQRQPKLKKINLPPLNKNRAEDLRNYLTDTSLARTALIKRVKQKPKQIKLNVPLGYASSTSNKFRDYRIVKGRRVTLPNSRIIEKSRNLLDTKQEVNRISLEKRIKQVIGKPVIRRSSISPYQRRMLLKRLEKARAVRMSNLIKK